MKYIKQLSTLAFITATLLMVSASPNIKPIFISDLIGPCLGDKDFEIYFYASKSTYTCSATLSYIGSGAIYGTRSFVAASTSSGASTPMELTLIDRMSTGVKIDLTLNTLKLTAYLYKPSKSSININRYRNEPYKTEHRFFKVYRNAVVSEESFDFSETNEYISCDSRNRLVFNNITFGYSPSTFYGKKAYLVVDDFYGVYPKFHNSLSGNTIRFPLAMNYESSVVSFEPSAILYVNPKTLDLSPDKIRNYVLTPDICVPIGKEEKLANSEMYIYIEGAGYDLTNITIPLQFYDAKQLFGFCYESDYCIIGGVKE